MLRISKSGSPFLILVLDLSSLPAPGLPGSLDKRPLYRYSLAQNVIAIQLLFGGQGLLVRLVLDQGVPLQEPGPSVQIQMDVLKMRR